MKNTNTLPRNLIMSLTFLAVFSIGCEKEPVEQIYDPLTAEQYFLYSIGGLQGYFTSPSDSVGVVNLAGKNNLFGYTTDHTKSLTASYTGTTASGNFPLDQLKLYLNSKSYVQLASDTPHIFISNYGAVGSYVEGTYSGKLKDSASSIVYTINGVFKLKRQN